tara:strand:- start:229 stop:495 length:267 start_codon:yes stop_codon:yes gene_type:complete
MKLELKTENENNPKSFSNVFKTVVILVPIIIFCDVAFKLGKISKYYQINYYCSLLSVEKSTSNFKNLSSLSNLKSKQKIWEFCREVVK